MQGKRIVAGCMLLLFLLSILSMWIPIPHVFIRGISIVLFVTSAIRNCLYYKKIKGRHSKVLWGVCAICTVVACLFMLTERFLWQVLYIVLLYSFFILAEVLLYGKFRKSYLLMGICVICIMIANVWTDNVWVGRSIFMLQVVLLLRLLNPILENIAERGRQKRIAQEKDKEVSFIRKILFGRSGRLRFPGITN